MLVSRQSIYQIGRRMVVVWLIELVALWLLALVLPGLSLEGWRAAAVAVAVIALLNALVRPVLLLLTLPFTVMSFGFLTLVLNALMLVLASSIVPGLSISNLGVAMIAALGLAAINTLIASLLSLNDEDSVYRNIVKRISGRSAPSAPDTTPGMIIIEIDGLSTPTLRRAIATGYVPTLARWLAEGTHRADMWDCGLPAQTSSSQAGILFGDNFDIPAFRWYDKDRSSMIVSNQPADAMWIERRISTGDGLLSDDGISICNMLSGDAPRSIATISTFTELAQQVRSTSSIYFTYYLNPYNFLRSIILMGWEFLVETWEAWRQSIRGVRPRVSRGGWFPLLRSVTAVLQRELGVYLLMSEMFAGVPIAYVTFVGYDVVAHHAGPDRPDSLRILRDLDRRIGALRRAADESKRPYHFVVLSDHGQSRSIPFSQRFGVTFESLVHRMLSGGRAVHSQRVAGEGWGHVNALLSEAILQERIASRAARRLLRRRTRDGYVELDRRKSDRPADDADVVACASGNLGLIYFKELPGRASFEKIANRHPQLIEGLVAHDGIAFVMVHSEEHGAIVMGRKGVRYLSNNRVEGSDPLEGYGANAADHLRRLDSFPHTGDLIVNGRFYPDTGEVIAFEDMVGAHGGLGGAQGQPFIIYPSQWHADPDQLRNATDVYDLLKRWHANLEGTAPFAIH